MHPLKSPDLVRLDGFHAQFFQNNWQVVGVETTEFIQTIFITSRIPMDLTRVKLVLIHKAPNPESVYQFRPISVCNTLYKLLTKILVNKLKPFLHAMIHPSQAGFVPGRRVTDNYVITQELIHYISQRKGNTYLMVAKIDLDKAYDKLEQSFIKYILLFYHFPAPIIDLIMACIASASISIIWNGKVSPAFTPSRGIWQGDPLSPYIFILCLIHLSLSLDLALHTKQLKPIRVSRRPIEFNHILYADDIFLFAHANVNVCNVLFNIFSQFCQISGQICSSSKSKLFLF